MCALNALIADGYVILDKYADQYFITPSDFGHVLTNELKQIQNEDDLAKKCIQIDDDNSSLKTELSCIKLKYEQQVSNIKSQAVSKINSTTKKLEQRIESLHDRNKKLMLVVTILSLALGFLSTHIFFKVKYMLVIVPYH